jgi:iron complex outermembrane receptor protein
MGSEVTWQHPFTSRGDLTFGVQGEWEFRNLQAEWAVSPNYVPIVRFNIPDRSAALFTQQEWRLTSRLKVYGGLRFDRSHNYGNALSPRIAAVYQQSPSTVYKFVYGSPFRNPSAFEKYFSDNETLVANLNLHAERANTLELSVERKLGSRFTGIADLYQYGTHDLIEEVFPDNAVPQYQNVARAQLRGAEFELSGKLPRELELLATAAFQRTIDADTGLALPNSPRTLAKLRLGMPVAGHRAFLASSVEYMSARGTNAGSQVAPVFLQDITLTMRKPVFGGFDLQAGVRNLWNSNVDDPVGLAVDTIREDGRSVFVKLMWHRLQ